jgi:hypothetical protein
MALSRCRIVPSDHDGTNAGRAAITDRLGHTWAKRIRKTDESKKRKANSVWERTPIRGALTSVTATRPMAAPGMGSSISPTITPAKIAK